MKKNNFASAALSLGALVVASIIILFVMNYISRGKILDTENTAVLNEFSGLISASSFEEISAGNAGEEYKGIEKAYRAKAENGNAAGYAVYVTTQGYSGPISLRVALDGQGKSVLGVRVAQQSETENLGAKITEEDFYGQFTGKTAPVSLSAGNTPSGEKKDGTYRVQASEFENGYRYFVELTISGGKITAVNWDAEAQGGGKTKKEASRDGDYIMTETGPRWHEQAELVEGELIKLQDVSKLVYNDDGKTDAIATVSITISEFAGLAQKCLEQAGNGTAGTDTVDGITGATISSRAVIDGVNLAARFVKEKGAA